MACMRDFQSARCGGDTMALTNSYSEPMMSWRCARSGTRVNLSSRRWCGMRVGALLCLLSASVISLSSAASAADCPGHPDAIGTSRTLVVDPAEHALIGTMQYHETLPLEDHEV